MGQSLSNPIDRPHCRCGAVLHLAGHGEGVFTVRETGQEARDHWYRLECPKRRTEPGQDHFLVRVNLAGEIVDIPRRRFRLDQGPRPLCPACKEPMRAHAVKKTRHHGTGRYFACGNSRCDRQNGAMLYLGSWEGGWKEAGNLPLGPKRKAAGFLCPRCGNDTLASRGRFPATKAHPRKYPKYECLDAECRRKGPYQAVFRLVDGELVPAPPPGFQRPYDVPTCPAHGVEMVRHVRNQPTVEGRRVHRWKCPRATCDRQVVTGSDGKPIDWQPTPRPPRETWAKCWIPTCHRPIDDYVADHRNHSCEEHRKLTRVQRCRLRKKLRADVAADGAHRLGYVPVVGSELRRTDGISVEFGRWLRSVIEGKGLSIADAAARAGFKDTTVWHWSHGDSMPRSEPDFKALGDVLGCSLRDFYIQTDTLYRSAAQRTSRAPEAAGRGSLHHARTPHRAPAAPHSGMAGRPRERRSKPSLGAAITRARGDISQTEIARRAKVSTAYLSFLEGGERKSPALAVLQRIAKALGVPVAELLE